ncbi:MAG: protein kinase, partial [Myxococcota bacterium]
MLCFRCGSHVKDDAESCWHCGADLTQRAKGSAQERVRPASRLFAIAYETGDLIAKRYRVKAMLGSGGAGVVYRVHDEEIDVDVAVKVIHGKLVQTDEERRLFAKQTTIARKLIHSNCIRIYDDGLDQERPYFTMQLLEGLTLRRIIDLRKEKGSVFTPAEVRPVFDQICQALLYAHRTTFHGNLKPDNVLVLPDLLKVTDFGLLSGLPRKPFLALQKPRGSNLRYLAPEVRLEVSELNRSVDMYSLGVILLEMLAGHVYDDKDPLSLEAASKSLALPLQSLIRSCLARSPQERPPSVDVFYSALAAASGAGATGDALTASIGLAVPLPGAAAEVQVQSVTEEPVHPRAVLAPSSPPTSPVVPGTPKSAQTPAVAPDEGLSSALPATQRAVGDEHAASSAPKATPFASDQSDASATAASASESSVEVSEHLSVPLPDLSNLPSPSGQASEPNVSARSVSPLPSRSPEPASPATEGDSSTVVPSRPRRGPPYDEPTQRLEVAAQASNFDEALGDLLREPSMALQIDDDMIESESTARSQEVIAESPIVDVEDAESLHDSVFQDVDETLVGGQQRPASEAGFASAALPRLDSLDEIGSSAIELIEAPESMAASGEVSAKSLPSFPSARPGPAGTVAPSSSPAPSEVAASSSPVPLEPGGARSPVPLESGSSRSPVPLDSVSSRSPVPLESGSSRSPVPSEMALSGRPTGAASRATEAGGDAPETEPAQPPLGVEGLDGAPKTDPLPAPLP